MTTSSEDSVELEAKVATTPRLSHHRASRRKRIAARILLILALVIGVLAISDFALNAYIKSDCSIDEVTTWDRSTRPTAASEVCSAEVDRIEERMQWDAIAVLFAVIFLIGSTVISRRMKRGRRDRDDHTLPRWPFLHRQLEMIFALHRGAKAEGAEAILKRHKARRRMKIVARVALALGLVVGFVAISDFANNAYERADHLDRISFVDTNGRRVAKDDGSNFSDAHLSHSEELQQLDSAAVVLAAACVITSTVISRRVKRHRR